MNRYARDSRAGRPKPVEQVELKEGHEKLRLTAVILLIGVAVAALGFGLYSLLNREPGWTEITVNSDAGINCSGDLDFRYNFQGGNATVESKRLTALYTQCTQRAYAMYQSRRAVGDVKGVFAINDGVNTPVAVEPELYEALAQVKAADSRLLYLAPVYAEYEQIFRCMYDYEAADFDPFTNPEQQDYIREVLQWVNSPADVDLELLGDNRVILHVSDGYLRFAEENGISCFLDFYWMKNAFILDYIAACLRAEGFTAGTISSFDGFYVNLDRGAYHMNVYSGGDGVLRLAAVADYEAPVSMVSYRAYPLTEGIGDYYYTLESGEVRTPYVDARDGLCRGAAPELIAYSHDRGCGEILLETAPLYISETLDAQALNALRDAGIFALYGLGHDICYNDTSLTLHDLYQSESVYYCAVYVGNGVVTE